MHGLYMTPSRVVGGSNPIGRRKKILSFFSIVFIINDYSTGSKELMASIKHPYKFLWAYGYLWAL